MTTYVTDEDRVQSSLADHNAEKPCGGIFIDGQDPVCCEVHLLPWGHARHHGQTEAGNGLAQGSDRKHRQDS